MTDYWRPGFSKQYRDKIEQFLEQHPELPHEDPREFIKFCADQMMMDVITSKEAMEEAEERIKEELKDNLDDL